MPPTLQGIIIAVLIALLMGIIIGFYLRQSRINQLTTALQQSQERNGALQKEHEERLQAATLKLQQDYETQLAESMERYQRQYEDQLKQLEAEYQARLSLLEQGPPPAGSEPAYPGPFPAGVIDPSAYPEIEQRIRKQYEARLKEAALKIQQAYEQHLRDKLAEAREAYQQDYDQRLAEAIQRYQDETETRLAEALTDQTLAAAALGSGSLAGDAVMPLPRAEEPALQERLAILEASLRADYDKRLAQRIEAYQDEMAQRTAQLEQEFAARLQMSQAVQIAEGAPEGARSVADPSDLAARLRSEIEASLRADYEQRLAEKIEQYQDELTQRTRELEEGLEARLQVLQTPTDPALMGLTSSELVPTESPSFGLDDVLAIPNEATDSPSAMAEAIAPDPFDPSLFSTPETIDLNSPDSWEGAIATDITPETDNFDLADLDALLGQGNPVDASTGENLNSLDDFSNPS